MICLGVDIGGTGCKCAAFDECGVQYALSYAEYTLGSRVSCRMHRIRWQKCATH